MTATEAVPEGLFPAEIRGWTPAGPVETYDAETLHRYINGASEVYKSFDIRKAYTQRYVKAGAPDLIADVFDMGSSKNAYGAYHHDIHEGPSAGIGRESEAIGNSIYLWKGRYYASVLVPRRTDEALAAARELARAIADTVADEGEPPAVVALLPGEGRIAARVHYFHDPALLNAKYFLAEDNLLDIGPDTDGVLAHYRLPGGGRDVSAVLLIVHYPSEARAEKAAAAFRAGYLPDADDGGLARLEDGSWAGVRRHGPYVYAAFDAPGREEAVRLLDRAHDNLSRAANQKGNTP